MARFSFRNWDKPCESVPAKPARALCNAQILLCAALLAWSGLASAVIYKWTDAQGKVQYGDSPPDGVHAEVVDIVGNRAARAVAGPVDAPAQAPKVASTTPASHDDGAKESVDDDVAQVREKQCTDAQDRYKKLIEARRLYKAGADGERQYLSSDEIDAQRLTAKHDVDSLCNGAT